MNTTEIAAALLAATTLTEETTAPIREYRRTKRATGAPVDLEDAVVHAANRCQEAVEVLRDHLLRARREADERIAALDHSGVRMGQFTWFVLDGRKTAEDLNARLCAARERFEGAIELWVALADRIVATDEDRARKASEDRDRAIRQLAALPARDLRRMGQERGLSVGTDRTETATALVDAGHTRGRLSATEAPCRPHNVTFTAEVWEHALRTYGRRGVAAALENAYRAQHGMPPRPDVAERGRFVPGENAHTRRALEDAMKKRQPMTAPDLVDAVTDMLYAAEETARRVAALGEAEEAARWTGYAKRARALLARLRAG